MTSRHMIERVYTHITAVIEVTGLPPSHREMSESLHIAVATVNGAIDALVAEGRLTRVSGSGRALSLPRLTPLPLTIVENGVTTTYEYVGVRYDDWMVPVYSYRRKATADAV